MLDRTISRGFYDSDAWRRTRAAYMEAHNHICERCGRPARVVHHKVWLDESNIGDPSVSLNWDNLECLCQDCHNAEHFGSRAVAPGLAFTSDGELVPVDVASASRTFVGHSPSVRGGDGRSDLSRGDGRSDPEPSSPGVCGGAHASVRTLWGATRRA